VTLRALIVTLVMELHFTHEPSGLYIHGSKMIAANQLRDPSSVSSRVPLSYRSGSKEKAARPCFNQIINIYLCRIKD
jgi:hypothetical protein